MYVIDLLIYENYKLPETHFKTINKLVNNMTETAEALFYMKLSCRR
jgi:hypothetical protein